MNKNNLFMKVICGIVISAGDELDDFDRKLYEQFEKVDRFIENPPRLLPLQSRELYDYVSRSLEPGELGGPSLQDLGDPEGLDPAKAFQLFQGIAEEGYVVAKFFVGLMLYIGLGVERDREKGERYLQEQGIYTGVTRETFDEMQMSEELMEEQKWFWIQFWSMSSVIDYLYVGLKTGSKGKGDE